MTRCKSCDAPIRWVKMAKGRLMPIDDLAYEDGNIVVQGGRGFVLSKEDAEMYQGVLFKSHFATCPNAQEHRNPPGRGA